VLALYTERLAWPHRYSRSIVERALGQQTDCDDRAISVSAKRPDDAAIMTDSPSRARDSTYACGRIDQRGAGAPRLAPFSGYDAARRAAQLRCRRRSGEAVANAIEPRLRPRPNQRSCSRGVGTRDVTILVGDGGAWRYPATDDARTRHRVHARTLRHARIDPHANGTSVASVSKLHKKLADVSARPDLTATACPSSSREIAAALIAGRSGNPARSGIERGSRLRGGFHAFATTSSA